MARAASGGSPIAAGFRSSNSRRRRKVPAMPAAALRVVPELEGPHTGASCRETLASTPKHVSIAGRSEFMTRDRGTGRSTSCSSTIGPENLLALEAILEPLGQRLVRASSGEAALRYLLDVRLRRHSARRADAGDERVRDGAHDQGARTHAVHSDHLPHRDQQGRGVRLRGILRRRGGLHVQAVPARRAPQQKSQVFVELYRQQRRLAVQEQ